MKKNSYIRGLNKWYILVIQYTKNEEDISLYEADFKKQGNNYYSFFKGNLISKGKNNICEILKEKNNSYKGGDISYYVLLTPIQYLNNFIEDENIKNRVQFIDLPGLNILEKNTEEKTLSNLIEYINLFLYTNYANIVLTKENKQSIVKTLNFNISKKNISIQLSLFLIFLMNWKTKMKMKMKKKVF